jgi:uncharacterized protein YgiB involved in biofilm formation
MKIKYSLRATLLGATALVLSACGEAKEEALTYDSVESCIRAGIKDAKTCQAEFQSALVLHNKVAPRYARQNECFSDFGYDRCRRSSSGFWLPFMVGYMIAPRLSSGIYTQPLYRTTGYPNGYTTASNAPIGSVARDGRTRVAKSKLKRPRVRTRTVARSGFGRRAYSSGG